MSEPIKNPGIIPESYEPKIPEIAKMMDELYSEKIVDTVVIEGVEFQIIEKGKTLYAGVYAVETDLENNPNYNQYETDDQILFAGRQVDEKIKTIRNSITPDYNISLNIDYTTDERPCAMLTGKETTSREQPDGIHVIEAKSTLLIKVEQTHASFALTKKLTGKCFQQYQMSELFGLIKHIFCEGDGAEYEYNGDNGSGNSDAEHYPLNPPLARGRNGYVTVPVKRKTGVMKNSTNNTEIAKPITPRSAQEIQAAQITPNKFNKLQFGGRDWLVLDEQDGKALIMTETVDYKEFHKPDVEITWADCELREYLNSEFYNSFSGDEKSRIIKTKVSPCYSNPWHGTSGGKSRIIQLKEKNYLSDVVQHSTDDYIFLLSIEELIKYTGDSGDLENRIGWTWGGADIHNMEFRDGLGQFLYDQYNDSRIAKDASGEASWWRLRSPGYQYIYTVVVSPIGAIIFTGTPHGLNGIRPAMWVKT